MWIYEDRVRVGDPAPATPVCLYDARMPIYVNSRVTSLAGLAGHDRPLVLNFGSCT